ncbi:MAG: hypothetical protein AAGB15_01840 [Pseudomonadota bacterium]
MTTRHSGFLWPLLTVFGGLAVYFLLFGLFVDPLTPRVEALRSVSYTFLWELPDPPPAAEIIAADTNARYAIAIPTVLLALTFAAVLISSFAVVLPRLGRAAVPLGVAAVPAGATVGYLEQYNNPVRAGVTNCRPGTGETFCPLNQAVERAGEPAFFTEDSLSLILRLVDLNSAISVSAIFLLGITFLFIARIRPEAYLTPDRLRARRTALTSAITLAGLTLLFSVATTHGFYHHAASLMPEEDAKALAALGSTGSIYWGAVYSTVFTVIAVPAVFGMFRDVDRAARHHLPDATHAERQKWCTEHGLSLDVRDTLTPLLASLSPVLATPALDFFRPALVGG